MPKRHGKKQEESPGGVTTESAFFPIVGIGASAGGLAAFEAFFSGMPTDRDPGMAFVLVQHLAPDHKSLLSDLIRRYTRMQVFDVEDGMVVQPNCAYIIPPSLDMAIMHGALHLLEPTTPRGQRLPIDYFFKTLATEQRERAVVIVLSGTGSDGTMGVRAIKDVGGTVLVQSPASCEFGGMPQSAIATGLVDYQLTPAEMPARLIALAAKPVGALPRTEVLLHPKSDSALKKIFMLLRTQTGHDFSNYKPSTIHRRIDRRLAVHQIHDFDSYVAYLQHSPAEVDALFKDMLIGVTNFFRDPEAFKVLEEQVIPKLFQGKPPGAPVRAWSAGCSTGEEAYSLAILMLEHMEVLKQHYALQIFATDIDNRAISVARAGQYPSSIAADISPERLSRFFVKAQDGQSYRIHKTVRDLLVFSEQDIIQDPPFSRLDFISCRNLMIYLDISLQKRLIPLFYYALKPGGVLFLGTSEGVGEFDAMFAAIDRKSKLYIRNENRQDFRRFVQSGLMTSNFHPTSPSLSIAAVKPQQLMKPPMRELTEQAILRQIAPASALVNGDGDILYLHGRTGMYLEPSPGEAGVQNILKMAREGLHPSLSIALRQVIATKREAYAHNINVKTNGHFTRVNLGVYPVLQPGKTIKEASLYLLMLHDAPVGAESPSTRIEESIQASDPTQAETLIQSLTQELRAKDEYLRSAEELVESSNEELKSSNEEMQSINEELQSSNEELETSKEELQSVNEELSTVNAELQTKVADLSRTNDDMRNLLAGSGVGTLFVDHELRILRFTPAIADIIHLIDSDIGRPVAHFVASMENYNSLVQDVKQVLSTLTPFQKEVRAQNGQWYLLHIQPYRTLKNVIEGAVISLTNITVLKQTEVSLRNANLALQRMAVVVRDSSDAITVQNLEGRTLAWNPGAVHLYGWSEEEALQLNVRDRIPEDQYESELAKLASLSRSVVIHPYLTRRITKSGAVLEVSVTTSPLLNQAGDLYAVATTERAKLPDMHDNRLFA